MLIKLAKARQITVCEHLNIFVPVTDLEQKGSRMQSGPTEGRKSINANKNAK